MTRRSKRPIRRRKGGALPFVSTGFRVLSHITAMSAKENLRYQDIVIKPDTAEYDYSPLDFLEYNETASKAYVDDAAEEYEAEGGADVIAFRDPNISEKEFNRRSAIRAKNSATSTYVIISSEMQNDILNEINRLPQDKRDVIMLWKITSRKLPVPFFVQGLHAFGDSLRLPQDLFNNVRNANNVLNLELVYDVPLIAKMDIEYDPTSAPGFDIRNDIRDIITLCYPVITKDVVLYSVRRGVEYKITALYDSNNEEIKAGRSIGIGDVEINLNTQYNAQAVETTKQRMIDTKMKLAEAKQQEEIRGEMMRARMEEEERKRKEEEERLRQAEYDASRRAVASAADRPSSANLTLAQLREENKRLRREAEESKLKR